MEEHDPSKLFYANTIFSVIIHFFLTQLLYINCVRLINEISLFIFCVIIYMFCIIEMIKVSFQMILRLRLTLT